MININTSLFRRQSLRNKIIKYIYNKETNDRGRVTYNCLTELDIFRTGEGEREAFLLSLLFPFPLLKHIKEVLSSGPKHKRRKTNDGETSAFFLEGAFLAGIAREVNRDRA